jgi:purine-binding chemotaxis protein CheW
MSGQTQYCTFGLSGLWFGVPVQQVQEVLRDQVLTRVPRAAAEVCGLINLRGQIVTAIDLRRRLGLPPHPQGRPPMNVVIRGEEGAVSLLVDEIGDVQEVHETLFEPPPPTLQGPTRHLLRGAYKLPQHLLLVLDTQRAVEVSEP